MTVGLIGYKEESRFGNYLAAIKACGVDVIIMDHLCAECDKDESAKYNCDRGVCAEEKYVDRIDALVIAGGVDINPARYHEPNTASENIDDSLDAFEWKVLQAVIARNIPILGICRGHQLLNVFFGGTLIQNIDTADQHVRKGETDQAHETICEKDSFIYEIYGRQDISVNSAHHQAIGKLGTDFTVVQRCKDGTIEAIRHKSLPIYGVQWHPERMCLKHRREDTVDGIELFRYFIKKYM